MANTVNPSTKNGRSVEISAIDSSWDSSTYLTPRTMFVNMIVFKPGAANDYIVIRDGSATGPSIKLISLDGEPRIVYFGNQHMVPYFYYNTGEYTLSAGHSLTIYYSER